MADKESRECFPMPYECGSSGGIQLPRIELNTVATMK